MKKTRRKQKTARRKTGRKTKSERKRLTRRHKHRKQKLQKTRRRRGGLSESEITIITNTFNSHLANTESRVRQVKDYLLEEYGEDEKARELIQKLFSEKMTKLRAAAKAARDAKARATARGHRVNPDAALVGANAYTIDERATQRNSEQRAIDNSISTSLAGSSLMHSSND